MSTLDYDGVPVRVIDPEHLVALAFQAGGHKRRERAWQLIEVAPSTVSVFTNCCRRTGS
jgi:hypothetical protein